MDTLSTLALAWGGSIFIGIATGLMFGHRLPGLALTLVLAVTWATVITAIGIGGR